MYFVVGIHLSYNESTKRQNPQYVLSSMLKSFEFKPHQEIAIGPDGSWDLL